MKEEEHKAGREIHETDDHCPYNLATIVKEMSAEFGVREKTVRSAMEELFATGKLSGPVRI